MPPDQLDILQAVILGIVEGITEYLPISSTGHLILTSAFLGLDETVQQKHAIDAFNIVIQGGAILAVLGLYWKRVLQMILGLLGKDAPGLRMVANLIIAFLPAAVFGVLLDDWIEAHLFFPIPVIAALAVGGLLMIVIGPWQRRRFHDDTRADNHGAFSFVDIEHLTWKRALIIGFLQCIAMWPGTSRSMMTIVGGMFVGLRPKHAAEFSFLLGLPTLGGACVYKAAKNFAGDGPNMLKTLGAAPAIVGIIVAFIAAALAIKWLVGYLTKHGLAIFGWYRLVLSAGILAMILSGALTIEPPAEDVPHAAPATGPAVALNQCRP
ncbi:MAG: undecaprenyl-diphosphate phosphatase [Phycisphaerales bacterium]|nr:MAG: undecaprenyl-diphosphate phosphatase [Phycisphaerales bacterium]